VVLLVEVSTAWRTATVGIRTAAATSRIRAIVFEFFTSEAIPASNRRSNR